MITTLSFVSNYASFFLLQILGKRGSIQSADELTLLCTHTEVVSAPLVPSVVLVNISEHPSITNSKSSITQFCFG